MVETGQRESRLSDIQVDVSREDRIRNVRKNQDLNSYYMILHVKTLATTLHPALSQECHYDQNRYATM